MSNIVVSATGSVFAIIFVSFRYESNTVFGLLEHAL